jgi:hypothetical protein
MFRQPDSIRRPLTMGQIRTPDAASADLQDLLADFIATEPFTPALIAQAEAAALQASDAAAAAAASEANARSSENTAVQAAIAAGAPIVASLTTPVPANGTVELLIVPNGIQLYRVVAGAWVAQSCSVISQASPTDTTAGRLLKVGAFGLGGVNMLIGDISVVDNSISTGFYTYGVPNGSVGAPSWVTRANFIHHRRSSGGGETQILVIEQPASRAGEILTRSRIDAAWSEWSRTVTNRNVLGTVSQSGGVPTGAIIERGSNANGEYVRFADGTQICTFVGPAVAVDNATGAIFQHINALAWSFPAAFSSNPVVSGGGGQSARWLGIGEPAISVVGYRVYSHVSTATLLSPSLAAIGRWF